MIIIGLVDIHGHGNFIADMGDELAKADVVLIAGDITNFGGEAEARKIIDNIQRYNKRILAVTGNCDYRGVADFLEGEGMSLERRCEIIDSVAFIGWDGSAGPTRGDAEREASAELLRDFESLAGQVPEGMEMVFVSHYPPYGTSLDTVHSGRHVGSGAVRDFIARFGPRLVLCGHIHESPGEEQAGDNRVLVNPGPFYSGNYLYAELAGELEKVESRQIKR